MLAVARNGYPSRILEMTIFDARLAAHRRLTRPPPTTCRVRLASAYGAVMSDGDDRVGRNRKCSSEHLRRSDDQHLIEPADLVVSSHPCFTPFHARSA